MHAADPSFDVNSAHAAIAAAETLLAATGNAVALCPTYGTGARGAAIDTEETRQ